MLQSYFSTSDTIADIRWQSCHNVPPYCTSLRQVFYKASALGLDIRCMAFAQVSAASANPSGRVVVTGQGVVSSLGQDVKTFYTNLLEV